MQHLKYLFNHVRQWRIKYDAYAFILGSGVQFPHALLLLIRAQVPHALLLLIRAQLCP